MPVVTFFFPGQGSQVVGMGKAFADAYPIAKRTFEEADEALGFGLSDKCWNGPEEDLRRTELTQPAILTTSIAALRVLLDQRPDLVPKYAAGHSLGEITSLVAVGAIRFDDAVRLVKERGRLMQAAVPEGQGAMAAVLGLQPEDVRATCEKVAQEMGDVVVAANYNSNEQTVISGTVAGVAGAQKALEAQGAKKVAMLPVSAPFHSPLMKPAAEGLAAALERIAIGPLAYPVITNVEAKPNQDPSRVKQLLVDQVTGAVRWVEIVRWLVGEGERVAVEIGPSKVLMGLGRRIDRALTILHVDDFNHFDEKLAKAEE